MAIKCKKRPGNQGYLNWEASKSDLLATCVLPFSASSNPLLLNPKNGGLPMEARIKNTTPNKPKDGVYIEFKNDSEIPQWLDKKRALIGGLTEESSDTLRLSNDKSPVSLASPAIPYEPEDLVEVGPGQTVNSDIFHWNVKPQDSLSIVYLAAHPLAGPSSTLELVETLPVAVFGYMERR